MRQTTKARHTLGIRGQLMWFLCFICLFLLGLFWLLSTQLLEPLYTKHIEKQLTTQAENITADLDKALAEDETLSSWSFGRLSVNTSFFDRLATQLYASGSLNSFCVDISDSTMRTIYKIENQSYCNLHETLLSDSANNDMIVSTAVAMRKKCRTTGGFVQTLNPPRLSGSAQLLVGRNTAGGEYTVLVTTSLVHVAEAGKILSTVLPMAAAVIFAFAMTAGWLFSEWFTKPLRQLSSAARQMAMGNYAVQVDTRRSDELGDLAQDFNHMANEVQRSSQMQRDLLANVSHDLRTPLTAICGYLDLLEQEPHSPRGKRYLAVIRERTDAMRTMTEELFRYSVVTAATDELNREPVCLNHVLEQGLAGFYSALSARGITPEIQLAETAVVRELDAAALRRIFDNILSNAAKYSDGDLVVRLMPDGAVTFTNSARSLNRVQAERLFDRFFTVETASGSTGLGLSIARLLTEKMGGSIDAAYSGGRLTIRVAFPQ